MRKVTLARETKETKIALTLNPDGTGKVSVETGIPFFDHMLTGMAKHGGFDLTCTATRSRCRLPPHDRGYRNCPWRRRETGDGRRPGDTEVRARDHPDGRIPRTGSTRLRRTGVPGLFRHLRFPDAREHPS